MNEVTPEQVKIAVIEERIKGMDEKLNNLTKSFERVEAKLDNDYVRQKDHDDLNSKVDVLWDWRWKVMGVAFAAGAIADIVLRLLPFNL